MAVLQRQWQINPITFNRLVHVHVFKDAVRNGHNSDDLATCGEVTG